MFLEVCPMPTGVHILFADKNISFSTKRNCGYVDPGSGDVSSSVKNMHDNPFAAHVLFRWLLVQKIIKFGLDTNAPICIESFLANPKEYCGH